MAFDEDVSLRELFVAAAVRERGDLTLSTAYVIDYALALLARCYPLEEGARELLAKPGIDRMSLTQMMDAYKEIIYREPG